MFFKEVFPSFNFCYKFFFCDFKIRLNLQKCSHIFRINKGQLSLKFQIIKKIVKFSVISNVIH